LKFFIRIFVIKDWRLFPCSIWLWRCTYHGTGGSLSAQISGR